MSLERHFRALYGLKGHGVSVQPEQNAERLVQTSISHDSPLLRRLDEVFQSRDVIFQAAWGLTLMRHLSVENVEFDISKGVSGDRTSVEEGPTFTAAVELDPNISVVDFLSNIPSPAHTSVDASNKEETRSLLLLKSDSEQDNKCISRIACWDVIIAPYQLPSGGLTVVSWHSGSLPESFILAVLRHFVTLIESVVAYVGERTQTIGDLPMLSKEEMAMLSALARPGRSLSDISAGSMHQKFRQQARRTPEAPVLEDGDGSVTTYQQLDKMSDVMARELLDRISELKALPLDGGHEIEAAQTVAIMLGRTCGLLISMLACWKAGLACVILDPSHPESRNNYMIADAKCSFVIMDKTNGNNHEIYSSSWVYDFDALRDVVNNGTSGSSSMEQDIFMIEFYHRLSWINYTSGSTGFPKGARQSHATFGTLICAFDHIPPQKTLLFFNPVSTAATIPLWITLITGGCLCVVPQSQLADLGHCIRQHQIENVYLTPSAVKLLQPEEVPTLKRLMLGGENVSSSLVSKWSNHLTVIPMYGSTELGCPYWKSYHETGDVPPLLSLPVTDVSVYVLRPGTSSLCGFYEAGELCFSTTHLSSGYVGLPEKTAAVFVDNPFASDSNHLRMYRSGDLGVLTPSGQLAILGRIDQQIKIDGNRVDPGEVETVLMRMECIKTATVLQVDLESGGSPLVACLVLRDTWPSSEWDRIIYESGACCSQHLPKYMVPQRWARFDSIPLTPTGKTDLKQLLVDARAIFTQRISSQEEDKRQLTIEEEALIEACQLATTGPGNVSLNLQQKQRMLDDSFSENGGSSLVAMLAMNHLSKKGWTVALADLYSVNLRDVARRMRPLTTENSRIGKNSYTLSAEFPLNYDDIEAVYPAATYQCEMFLTSLQLPKQHCLYRYLDLSAGGYTIGQVHEALQVLMDTKSILRTVLVPSGPVPVESWGLGYQGLLQVVRSKVFFEFGPSYNATDVKEHYAKDATVPWEFGKSLWRAAFLDGPRLLAIVFHHALTDAWALDYSNEDLYAILEGIKFRDQHSQAADDRLSEAISHARRPSPESWIMETYQGKGLDGQPLPAYMTQYSRQWQEFMKSATPTYLNNVAYLPPTPLDQPPPSPLSISFDLHYLPFCRRLNITTGALLHTTWAITLAHLAGLDTTNGNDVTYYRYGGNRELQPLALEIEGALITVSPMRLLLDPTHTASKLAIQAMQAYIKMRPAEPYYVDQIQEGGLQGMIRPYGNTMFNHIVPVKQPDVPSPGMLADVTEGRGFFCEQTAFCCMELVVIEDDPRRGESITLNPYYCVEDDVVREMMRIFQAVATEIIRSGGTTTVGELMQIELPNSTDRSFCKDRRSYLHKSEDIATNITE